MRSSLSQPELEERVNATHSLDLLVRLGHMRFDRSQRIKSLLFPIVDEIDPRNAFPSQEDE